MRTNEEIIELIKEKLDSSTMSMTELATKAGVSKSTLSRYLSYSRDFPLNKTDDFAKALNMTSEQFLGIAPNIVFGNNHGVNGLNAGSGNNNTYNFNSQDDECRKGYNDNILEAVAIDRKTQLKIIELFERQLKIQQEMSTKLDAIIELLRK